MEEKPINSQQNSPAQGQAPAGNYTRADSPTVNDGKAAFAKADLQQGTTGREPDPEYGGAADTTLEKSGNGRRDDASPINTSKT